MGLPPNFLRDFSSSHPSPFFSPSSPFFLSPPFLVFCEPKRQNVDLTSIDNILMDGSPINTIYDLEKKHLLSFQHVAFFTLRVFLSLSLSIQLHGTPLDTPFLL